MTMEMHTEATPQFVEREIKKRGFTLTEIAIVLGIIGLILGAVWAAATAVYSNIRVSQAEQGITQTAQAVRSMFAASGNTGVAALTIITTPGMFPVSWVNGVNYGNPWNPPTGVASYVNGNGTFFDIELTGVPNAACAALANYFGFSASSQNNGQIVGLWGATVGTAAGYAASLATAFPVAFAAANFSGGAACTHDAAGVPKNDVTVMFNMAYM